MSEFDSDVDSVLEWDIQRYGAADGAVILANFKVTTETGFIQPEQLPAVDLPNAALASGTGRD
jgi:hypothetical protein